MICAAPRLMALSRASGAQAALPADHRGHQLVGVEAALHECLGLAGASERDRPLGRLVAVRGFAEAERADVGAEGRRGGLHLRLRPDQNGFDDPEFRRFEHGDEGSLVAGMSDRDLQLRQRPGSRDQVVVFLVTAWPGHGELQCRGRHDGLLWTSTDRIRGFATSPDGRSKPVRSGAAVPNPIASHTNLPGHLRRVDRHELIRF